MYVVKIVRLWLAQAEEVFFYDAVETADDLQSIDDGPKSKPKDPRLVDLQSKLVKICRNKAAVRNRKVSCYLCFRSCWVGDLTNWFSREWRVVLTDVLNMPAGIFMLCRRPSSRASSWKFRRNWKRRCTPGSITLYSWYSMLISIEAGSCLS